MSYITAATQKTLNGQGTRCVNASNLTSTSMRFRSESSFRPSPQ